MSPHGIEGPPNQSSRNSGNKFRFARPLNAVEFRRAPTKTVPDMRFRNFLLPVGRVKLDQVQPNRLRPATHQCPLSSQILSSSAKPYTRKTLQFLHPLVFLLKREAHWAKTVQDNRCQKFLIPVKSRPMITKFAEC